MGLATTPPAARALRLLAVTKLDLRRALRRLHAGQRSLDRIEALLQQVAAAPQRAVDGDSRP